MAAPAARPRPGIGLLALALLAVPAWLVFTRWMDQDVSGWSHLAERHAAGDRPLKGSVGAVTVALQLGGGPRKVFANSRGSRPYMELGLADDGFWLRSLRSAPSPAVFVPWSAVDRCLLFSAWLHEPGQPPLRLTVQHEGFEARCAQALAGRKTAQAAQP